MCLTFTATPAIPNRVGARRLSEVSGLHVRKAAGTFHLSRGPGCGCSLLSESVGFSDETWEFEPGALPAVEAAIRLLATEAGGCSFEALWDGDEVESESAVTLEEAIAAIRENRIRNSHRYRVEAPAR